MSPVHSILTSVADHYFHMDKAEIIGRVGESMERLSKRVPESRIQSYRQ